MNFSSLTFNSYEFVFVFLPVVVLRLLGVATDTIRQLLARRREPCLLRDVRTHLPAAAALYLHPRLFRRRPNLRLKPGRLRTYFVRRQCRHPARHLVGLQVSRLDYLECQRLHHLDGVGRR